MGPDPRRDGMSGSPKKPQSYAQSYAQVYADWQRDPEAFWMQLAEDIDWIKKPSRALFAERAPFYTCLLYTSPSPRDPNRSRMPSSA